MGLTGPNKERDNRMYHKVLVLLALDHGLSEDLVSVARHLTATGGQIHALHVVEAPHGLARSTQDAASEAQALKRAGDLMRSRLQNVADVTPHLVQGHVYRAILDFAATHDVSCMVMGSHRPGFSDFLLGSIAARVVRHAPCAVHVHRAL